MIAALDRQMAKRNDVSVKMDESVVEDCRIAAAFCGMTLAEYLSERMRVVAKEDIDSGYARRAKAENDPQTSGPGELGAPKRKRKKDS
jgi:hypothetical protein